MLLVVVDVKGLVGLAEGAGGLERVASKGGECRGSVSARVSENGDGWLRDAGIERKPGSRGLLTISSKSVENTNEKRDDDSKTSSRDVSTSMMRSLRLFPV